MIDIPKLIRGLTQGTPALRIRILTVLAKIDAVPEYVTGAEILAAVEKFTNDADPVVKYEARHALGKLKTVIADPAKENDAAGGAPAEPAPPGPVRPAQAPRFATRGEAEERLTHPDSQIRLKTVRELEKSGDGSWLPVLKARVQTETHAFVIASLVKAIGKLGALPEVETIRPHLSSPDARVRANAIEGLAMIGDTSIVELVKPLVEDPDNRVAANALLALSFFNTFAALGPIERMLASPRAAMRESAIHALREIGGPHALDLLLSGIGRTDPDRIKRRTVKAIEAIFAALPQAEREARDAARRGAIEELRTETPPEEGEDPAELAVIYENLEHWNDAIREYKRALAARPGNLPLLRKIRELTKRRDKE